MGQLIAEFVVVGGDLVPVGTSAHQVRHTCARHYLAQYPAACFTVRAAEADRGSARRG